MNLREKKSKWWAALILPSVLLLGGCGGEDAADRPGQGEKPPASVQPPEPVELVFYSLGQSSEESFNELYGDAIRKKYPHFKLTYIQRSGGTSIDDYMSTLLMGNQIDINFDSIGNIPSSLMKNELQYDMSELITKHKLDLSQYEQSAVDGMREIGGKGIYGLPVFNVNRLLFYNKDLFDKFGLPYPTDGMSWEQANELGRQMTRVDSGVQYVGLASSKEHQIRMNALSVPLLDPATNKPTIRSDERWRSVFEQGLFAPYQDSGYREAIAKGLPSRSWFSKTRNLAMNVYLSFMPANEPASFDGMNWDMVAEPTYSQAPGVSSQVYPTYFSIVTSSKKKDAAMQAIQVLLSPEHQSFLSRMGQIPVLDKPELKRELGQDTQFKDKNWQSVFHNKFAPIPYKSVYDVDLEKVYLKQHLDYALGKVDLNTLLRNAEEEALKLLEAR